MNTALSDHYTERRAAMLELQADQELLSRQLDHMIHSLLHGTDLWVPGSTVSDQHASQNDQVSSPRICAERSEETPDVNDHSQIGLEEEDDISSVDFESDQSQETNSKRHSTCSEIDDEQRLCGNEQNQHVNTESKISMDDNEDSSSADKDLIESDQTQDKNAFMSKPHSVSFELDETLPICATRNKEDVEEQSKTAVNEQVDVSDADQDASTTDQTGKTHTCKSEQESSRSNVSVEPMVTIPLAQQTGVTPLITVSSKDNGQGPSELSINATLPTNPAYKVGDDDRTEEDVLTEQDSTEGEDVSTDDDLERKSDSWVLCGDEISIKIFLSSVKEGDKNHTGQDPDDNAQIRDSRNQGVEEMSDDAIFSPANNEKVSSVEHPDDQEGTSDSGNDQEGTSYSGNDQEKEEKFNMDIQALVDVTRKALEGEPIPDKNSCDQVMVSDATDKRSDVTETNVTELQKSNTEASATTHKYTCDASHETTAFNATTESITMVSHCEDTVSRLERKSMDVSSDNSVETSTDKLISGVRESKSDESDAATIDKDSTNNETHQVKEIRGSNTKYTNKCISILLDVCSFLFAVWLYFFFMAFVFTDSK